MIRFKLDVHRAFLEFQAHAERLLNLKIISVRVIGAVNTSA
jgi:hypothetical protein